MPNQTSTPHTPISQTSSSSQDGNTEVTQQMKPIEISDKLRERVRKLSEQLPEMGPRVQALVDEDEKRKQKKTTKLKTI